ncbi:MAG: BrnT family toxin [Proteobacteria bacterium]|nr:BrnT family toxin [Pseudomonadota bacterium]
MTFLWDETKAANNLTKHGLDFRDAEVVFTSPCIKYRDDRFDYGETRYITLGLLGGRVVVIAHAPRGDNGTRIISMRKANSREQKAYQKRLETT